MKILEKLKGGAGGNKKKIIAVGAFVLIGLVAALLFASGKAGSLFKSANDLNSGQNNAASQNTIKQPERDADIVGLVESVTGNEIKIIKLNVVDLPGGMSRVKSGSAAGGAGTDANGANRSGTGQGWQGRTGGQGQGANSTAGKAARAAMIAELKKKSLGEETVTVPVGIQMMKRGGGVRPTGGGNTSGNASGADNANNTNNPGNNANGNAGSGGKNVPPRAGGVEANLSDLAVDKTVMIWLNAKVTDRKVAEFVSIMG